MSNRANNKRSSVPVARAEQLARLREALAELEHEQWTIWSRSLAEAEHLTPERLDQWKRRWVEYSALSESDKDLDREYADRVLRLLARSGVVPSAPDTGGGSSG